MERSVVAQKEKACVPSGERWRARTHTQQGGEDATLMKEV